MTMTDPSSALRQWVVENWPDLSLTDFTLRPEFHRRCDRAPAWQALPGDAGFRQYYRLASQPPLLAVYAPPDTEKNLEFVNIARLLREGGIHTPAIAACDLKQGFFLIEDFGPSMLFDALNKSNADKLYKQAMANLMVLQRCRADPKVLPLYDRPALIAEMNLFQQWFVEALLGVTLNHHQQALLEQLFQRLANSALEQPQVVVHRDYHSRNLVHRAAGPPGVIDFQDAVIGPMTYDLVSLLRDCYVKWPDQQVLQWAGLFRSWAVYSGLCPAEHEGCFVRWFDLMGLQRHIKVLGVFARLSLRDNKPRYLGDLPMVINYTLSIARQYQQCDAFVQWFETHLLPKIQQQPWWQLQ